jgi:hypothetical protein
MSAWAYNTGGKSIDSPLPNNLHNQGNAGNNQENLGKFSKYVKQKLFH